MGGGGGSLCCWPHAGTSSGKYSRRSTIDNGWGASGSGAHLSAASLQLPSTSGVQCKQPVSAHRSHEEIRRRSACTGTTSDRYSSAPSVIDEVLHRRHWDHSRDLHVSLHSDAELTHSFHVDCTGSSDDDDSYRAPLALADSASIHDGINIKKNFANIMFQSAPIDDGIYSDSKSIDNGTTIFKKYHPIINSDSASINDGTRILKKYYPIINPDSACIQDGLDSDSDSADEVSKICKKRYAIIKSSKKEIHDDDVKDIDATELNFYIGGVEREDTLIELRERAESLQTLVQDVRVLSLKEEKQSVNESIKSMERAEVSGCEDQRLRATGDPQDTRDALDPLDRSGATHSMESSGDVGHLPYTPSVEAVEYGSVASSPGAAWAAAARGRHASDTDVQPRPARPRSAPFSESDLELDALCAEDGTAHEQPAAPRRETAV